MLKTDMITPWGGSGTWFTANCGAQYITPYDAKKYSKNTYNNVGITVTDDKVFEEEDTDVHVLKHINTKNGILTVSILKKKA